MSAPRIHWNSGQAPPSFFSTGGRQSQQIIDRILTSARVTVSDPGELRVEYDIAQTLEIVAALEALAAAQGMDFFTDILFGPEREMLMRVLVGHGDTYTTAWYFHEAAEAGRIRETMTGPASGQAYVAIQIASHRWVETYQGTTMYQRYHPLVVLAYRDQFPR